MNKKFLIAGLFWGFIVWLIGYLLGIALFPIVPTSSIGWIIMPIGVIVTIFVLLKKVHAITFQQYLFLAFLWTTLAMLCDYLLLVKLINPPDGYYKLDVYLYYALTFTLPLIIGWRKKLL